MVDGGHFASEGAMGLKNGGIFATSVVFRTILGSCGGRSRACLCHHVAPVPGFGFRQRCRCASTGRLAAAVSELHDKAVTHQIGLADRIHC